MSPTRSDQIQRDAKKTGKGVTFTQPRDRKTGTRSPENSLEFQSGGARLGSGSAEKAANFLGKAQEDDGETARFVRGRKTC